MNQTFARFSMLIGDEGIEILKKSNVIVFGIGGVGSYIVESFARSGIGNITMVDFDEISESNINRQLHSLHSTIGRSKVEVMRERLLDINPECNIKLIKEMVINNINEILNAEKYDFVIDAIDVISSKINLIEYCLENNIPIISSMGFGNKMHPEMIEIAKIEKTSICPMARMVRKILKKKNLTGLTVAFSKEPNLVPNKSDTFKYELPTEFRENNDIPRKITPGSNAFVPGTAGFIISSYVIRKLLNME